VNRLALPVLLLVGSCRAAPGGKADGPPFYADKTRLLVWKDPEGTDHPVRSAPDWERRRAHILQNFLQVAGAPPESARKVPLDLKVLKSTPVQGATEETITYASEGDDRVPALLFLPDPPRGPAPAMLCLHPTSPLGKREISGMGKPNRQYALELARRGFVVLAPDYPNFGDYPIDVYARGWTSATMKGLWNHLRGVDLLESLPEVEVGRIGVIGHSLGGHNSMFLALFDRRVRAVVTSCGFNAFPKYMGGNLKGWSHRGYMPRIAEAYGADPARMPFDFTEILGALAPRPVFVNAPLHDSNFEVSGVRDCLEAARPVYRLLGAEGALVAVHPDCEHDFPPEVRVKAYQWLEKALQ
jgi:dienelactone hydrolase